jgi:hypothetical protein
MAVSKEEQKIKELRVLINRFRELSSRYPEHDGYNKMIRRLECDIADIGEQLFKDKNGRK